LVELLLILDPESYKNVSNQSGIAAYIYLFWSVFNYNQDNKRAFLATDQKIIISCSIQAIYQGERSWLRIRIFTADTQRTQRI
jgi:hypothetical protein